jgi:hypothetical protein
MIAHDLPADDRERLAYLQGLGSPSLIELVEACLVDLDGQREAAREARAERDAERRAAHDYRAELEQAKAGHRGCAETLDNGARQLAYVTEQRDELAAVVVDLERSWHTLRAEGDEAIVTVGRLPFVRVLAAAAKHDAEVDRRRGLDRLDTMVQSTYGRRPAPGVYSPAYDELRARAARTWAP